MSRLLEEALEAYRLENAVVATVQGHPYTRARLRAIFDLVANGQDWKLPIAANVLKSEATREELEAAVVFFTGSVPRISTATTLGCPSILLGITAEVPCWVVEADGYYLTIGA